jgi:MYXO-CTERM domain-containing protein
MMIRKQTGKFLGVAFTFACLATAGTAQASVIGVDTTFSGRVANDANPPTNFTFGGTLTPPAVSAFTVNNGLVGDNPGNDEFLGLWAYEVTPDFANDFNNGFTVEIDFQVRNNNSAAAAGPMDLYVLQVSSKTDALDVADDIVAGGLFGSIPNTPQTAYNFDITAQLVNAVSVGSMTAGSFIWIGIDPTLSANGTANNIYVGTAVDGNTPLVSTLTTIPEPGMFALAGLGAVAMLRRRRQTA